MQVAHQLWQWYSGQCLQGSYDPLSQSPPEFQLPKKWNDEMRVFQPLLVLYLDSHYSSVLDSLGDVRGCQCVTANDIPHQWLSMNTVFHPYVRKPRAFNSSQQCRPGIKMGQALLWDRCLLIAFVHTHKQLFHSTPRLKFKNTYVEGSLYAIRTYGVLLVLSTAWCMDVENVPYP